MKQCNWRRVLAVLAFAGATACGGGGGGGAPATYDLTGYWQLFLTPTGSSTEVGPMPVYLTQTGSQFGGVDVSGTMNGASFSISASGGDFTVSLAGTATSGDEATGTVIFSGAVTGNGTFRLERYQPAGTMDASGSLDGNTIASTSSNASGVRCYSDAGLTSLTSVYVVLADANIDLQITFDASGLAVGALSVPGTIGVEILLRIDGAVVSATVSSGTVTVTQYDANGIAGSYSLTTSVGTITGSFDVAFDIEEYDP
jgi:hypothetical protein